MWLSSDSRMLKSIHRIFFLNFIFGCIRSFVSSSFHSRAPTLENDLRLISNLDILIRKFFEADDRVLCMYESTFAVGKKTSFKFEGIRSLLTSCITNIHFTGKHKHPQIISFFTEDKLTVP